MKSAARDRNLSPLDHRYFEANEEIFEALADHLSESAHARYLLHTELALVCAHLESTDALTTKIEAELLAVTQSITAQDIAQEEAKTRHATRALVNVLSARLPEKLKPLVHLGATSSDIIGTADACALRDATRNVVLPLLAALALELVGIAQREAATPQIGRTHGQHAIPITFGYAMAEYVSRLGQSILEIDAQVSQLRGKLSGAVGAYHATGLLHKDPKAFEARFLVRLGLEAGDYSTQIAQPEPKLRLMQEMGNSFGIIANLADDLRSLARSEIGEVYEQFEPGQVGSSTMPQKRNPWNLEHVKSLWKAFIPRLLTFSMDQISEHQRDLTNSASDRFAPEFVAGLCAAANRMNKVLKNLGLDRNKMHAHLHLDPLILAEPAYVLLAQLGVPDAHEIVRKATLLAQKDTLSLSAAMLQIETSPEIHTKIITLVNSDRFPLLAENYLGLAAEQAKTIAAKYSALLQPFIHSPATHR